MFKKLVMVVVLAGVLSSGTGLKARNSLYPIVATFVSVTALTTFALILRHYSKKNAPVAGKMYDFPRFCDEYVIKAHAVYGEDVGVIIPGLGCSAAEILNYWILNENFILRHFQGYKVTTQDPDTFFKILVEETVCRVKEFIAEELAALPKVDSQSEETSVEFAIE